MHVNVIGQKVLGAAIRCGDTIFRVAAMTTPVTAAAAMIPVEECKLKLHDPADRLLPELADRSSGSTGRSTTPPPRAGRSGCATSAPSAPASA